MVQVKKKNVDKSAPFQKRKQKVGKKKLKPVGATSAEIHAQAIFMRRQTREENDEVKTERNLTFSDCVAKLKHYNPTVKKDGLFGIHSLLKTTVETDKEAIPSSSHATLIQNFLPLLVDVDVEVRKAVVALLKVGLRLFESTGTLRTLLPLIIRYLTVGLTHMEANVRANACRGLHLVCSATSSPLPESVTLLECCHTMLSSTSRPKDRSQPPVMQAYISILKSNLLSFSDTSGFNAGSGGVHIFAKSKEETASTSETKIDLSSFSSALQYLTNDVGNVVMPLWVEAVQERKSETRVAGWELGLLEILNVLFVSLSHKQVPERAMPKRFPALPKQFRNNLVKLFDYFPFASSASDTHRVNTQMALLLSNFFGVKSFEGHFSSQADTASSSSDDDDSSEGETDHKMSQKVMKWLAQFMRHPDAIKKVRPTDVQSLTIVIERLVKYGGVNNISKIPSVGDLLRSCEGKDSPITMEILAALHRTIEENEKKMRKNYTTLLACLPLFPSLLFNIALKYEKRAATEKSLDSEDSYSLPALVPTVDGGVVAAPIPPSHALSTSAFHIIDILKKLLLTGDAPGEALLEEFRYALFGVLGAEGAILGVVAQVPVQLAYMALSLLPFLFGEDTPASAPCEVLGMLLRCFKVDAVLGLGDAMAVEGATVARDKDQLIAYALSLLRDLDLSEGFDELSKLSAATTTMPLSAEAATLVLSDYYGEDTQ